MRIRGVMLGWRRNEKGYRVVDIEGLLVDAGKNGVADSVLESLVGQEVEAIVQVHWNRSQDGKPFARRRMLAIRPVD
ncbi:MAG: hypothetical protein QXI60_08315 [Thermofilaceae archaeon]